MSNEEMTEEEIAEISAIAFHLAFRFAYGAKDYAEAKERLRAFLDSQRGPGEDDEAIDYAGEGISIALDSIFGTEKN